MFEFSFNDSSTSVYQLSVDLSHLFVEIIDISLLE